MAIVNPLKLVLGTILDFIKNTAIPNSGMDTSLAIAIDRIFDQDLAWVELDSLPSYTDTLRELQVTLSFEADLEMAFRFEVSNDQLKEFESKIRELFIGVKATAMVDEGPKTGEVSEYDSFGEFLEENKLTIYRIGFLSDVVSANEWVVHLEDDKPEEDD